MSNSTGPELSLPSHTRTQMANVVVNARVATDPAELEVVVREELAAVASNIGASLSVVSLGIATFFWMQGATLVMPFAWAELVAVGIAFTVYARHARDGEKIFLQGGQLVVELETAGRLQRAEFNREWVRVEPKNGDGSLIEVSGQGRSVRVGRHVRPELRPALAREIRFALRGC